MPHVQESGTRIQRRSSAEMNLVSDFFMIKREPFIKIVYLEFYYIQVKCKHLAAVNTIHRIEFSKYIFLLHLFQLQNIFLYPCSFLCPACPPLNGALLTTSQNTNLIEGSVITFQCDPEFSLVGAATATCNNSGLWYPDRTLLECEFIDLCLPACMHVCCIMAYIGVAAPTGGNVASVAGGVTGGLLVLLLLVLVMIALLAKKRKSKGYNCLRIQY